MVSKKIESLEKSTASFVGADELSVHADTIDLSLVDAISEKSQFDFDEGFELVSDDDFELVSDGDFELVNKIVNSIDELTNNSEDEVTSRSEDKVITNLNTLFNESRPSELPDDFYVEVDDESVKSFHSITEELSKLNPDAKDYIPLHLRIPGDESEIKKDKTADNLTEGLGKLKALAAPKDSQDQKQKNYSSSRRRRRNRAKRVEQVQTNGAKKKTEDKAEVKEEQRPNQRKQNQNNKGKRGNKGKRRNKGKTPQSL